MASHMLTCRLPMCSYAFTVIVVREPHTMPIINAMCLVAMDARSRRAREHAFLVYILQEMRLHVSCIHVVLFPPATSCRGWLSYIFTGIIPLLFLLLRCIITVGMIPGQLATCRRCHHVSLEPEAAWLCRKSFTSRCTSNHLGSCQDACNQRTEPGRQSCHTYSMTVISVCHKSMRIWPQVEQ